MKLIYIPKSFKNTEGEVDWNRVKNFSLALSSIISALAIPLVGHWVSSAIKQQELELKYVELAVGILQEPPSEETKNLRLWATDIVNGYSDYKLSSEAKRELKEFILPSAAKQTESSYIQRVPSEPREIGLVVITDSGTTSANSTLKFFRDMRKGSYHYLIDVDGTVHKLVDEANIAYFAGRNSWKGTNVNDISVGIGLVHVPPSANFMKLKSGHPALGPDYPEAQLKALENLLVDICNRHEITQDAVIAKRELNPSRYHSDLNSKLIEKIRQAINRRIHRNGG